MIALLVVFPYFLFRFTNAFRAANRRLANALFLLSAILVVWTFALPKIPQQGQTRDGAFQAFVIVFFVHWAVLSIVSAWSLWRAGRAQPTVARRRMQFLALATGVLTLALLLAVFTTKQYSGLSLGSEILATVSVLAFLLGFSPPPILRICWRAPEQARVQQAIASLLTFAESQEEVASRVLEPAAAIVGARAIAIRNSEGAVVAAWNVPDERVDEPRARRGRAHAVGRRDASSTSRWPTAAAWSSGRLPTRRSSATRSCGCSRRSAR